MGRKRAKRFKVSKDKLSELPDELLSFILSFLSPREMVRSSILSRRWRYIWKTSTKYIHKINLDVLSMKGRNYANGYFHDFKRPETNKWSIFVSDEDDHVEKKKLLEKERRKFVRWADMMMQMDYNSVTDSFRLEFYLNKYFTRSIDQWLSIAITKGVKNFDIDLSNFAPIDNRNSDKLYKFPCHLFNKDAAGRVKRLSLSSCNLTNVDFKYFQSLVDLRLKDIDLSQDSIVSNFLRCCPNIEKLTLIKVGTPQRLDIVSFPTKKLRHLKIQDCYFPHVISIDAENLSKFEYVGDHVVFVFKLTQVLDVTFQFVEKKVPHGLHYALGNLSTDFPKLESLSLTVARHKDTTIRKKLPLFTNLKEMALKIICPREVLWGFVPLLQASPFLRRLELHLFQSAKKSDPVPSHLVVPHHHLRELMLTGFSGCRHDIEFVRYILSNCKNLENVTIDCRIRNYDYIEGRFYSALESSNFPKKVGSEESKIEVAARRELKNAIHPGLKLRFV